MSLVYYFLGYSVVTDEMQYYCDCCLRHVVMIASANGNIHLNAGRRQEVHRQASCGYTAACITRSKAAT